MLRPLFEFFLFCAVAAQDIRTATHGVPVDVPLSDQPSAQQKTERPPSAPEVQIQFNMPPLNLTALGHHAGEAAVGASVGAVAAWLVHRIQSTIVLLGVLGSVSTAAAVHLQWVSLEQVRPAAFSCAAAELVSSATLHPDGFASVKCLLCMIAGACLARCRFSLHQGSAVSADAPSRYRRGWRAHFQRWGCGIPTAGPDRAAACSSDRWSCRWVRERLQCSQVGSFIGYGTLTTWALSGGVGTTPRMRPETQLRHKSKTQELDMLSMVLL